MRVETYSVCRDSLQTEAAGKSLTVKRSVHPLDEIQLYDDEDDFQEDKRRTPFLGKRRANPFLGKRGRVNPFLGKRARHSPFLGKRIAGEEDSFAAEKRRMPFLGKRKMPFLG